MLITTRRMNNERRNERTNASFSAELQGPLGAHGRNELTRGRGGMLQRGCEMQGRRQAKPWADTCKCFWTPELFCSASESMTYSATWGGGRGRLLLQNKLSSYSHHLHTQCGPLSACPSATAPRRCYPLVPTGASESKADARLAPAKVLH